jgi:hypothetical protein
MKNGSISIELQGDFRKTTNFFQRCLSIAKLSVLDKYGRKGVEALSDNTPVDTGLASRSWRYEVVRNPGEVSIIWHNDDIENGYNVAVLVQYGHATKNGGWVEGVDYINPALKPVFEAIANDVFKEVNRH